MTYLHFINIHVYELDGTYFELDGWSSCTRICSCKSLRPSSSQDVWVWEMRLVMELCSGIVPMAATLS